MDEGGGIIMCQFWILHKSYSSDVSDCWLRVVPICSIADYYNYSFSSQQRKVALLLRNIRRRKFHVDCCVCILEALLYHPKAVISTSSPLTLAFSHDKGEGWCFGDSIVLLRCVVQRCSCVVVLRCLLFLRSRALRSRVVSGKQTAPIVYWMVKFLGKAALVKWQRPMDTCGNWTTNVAKGCARMLWQWHPRRHNANVVLWMVRMVVLGTCATHQVGGDGRGRDKNNNNM